jgi:hypothetical protein
MIPDKDDIDIIRPLYLPIWLRLCCQAKVWNRDSLGMFEHALDRELQALKKDAIKAAQEQWGMT